jgi:predicted phosphate transport protein (TIGR00153 family)
MSLFFKNSKYLEKQIEELLNCISQGIILFEEGITDYMHSRNKHFSEKLETLDDLENRADELRRQIENDLYQQSLIPEHRGDVLGLLENIDDLIDVAKETLYQFDVEHPYIPEQFDESYIQLAKTACQGAEAIVCSTRAFFSDVAAVKNDLHKVFFFEKEADKISRQLKREVFNTDSLKLSQKIHLRYFALHIDNIADVAETVADRLSIYTIKRSTW